MGLAGFINSAVMKFSAVKTLFVTGVLALSVSSLFAQSNGSAAKRSTPFIDGETLSYEGKISKIIRGIVVADLTLTLAKTADGEDFLVKAEARSKGTLLKLFRFSFLQEMQSSIDSENFRVVRTVKHDVQKERVRNSEALFDYSERRVTYVETDPNEPMRPPRRIASEIDDVSHDLISGIYSLRLMPLAVGKTFRISVSDSVSALFQRWRCLPAAAKCSGRRARGRRRKSRG